MTIKQISDIKIIEELHEKIFGYEFPLESFYKKTKKFDVFVFIYEEKGKNIGYGIVVDKEEQKTLYAWYGGILPEYQGKGITKKFFDMIVDIAREKSYDSITVATSNLRPHMLTFAINYGFDICDIKKRDTGEGNKIYFIYKILPIEKANISLIRDGKCVKPSDIENSIVVAYKKNCESFILDGIENENTLIYCIKYCNNFLRRPNIIINNFDNRAISDSLKAVIQSYKGNVKILN